MTAKATKKRYAKQIPASDLRVGDRIFYNRKGGKMKVEAVIRATVKDGEWVDDDAYISVKSGEPFFWLTMRASDLVSLVPGRRGA